MSNIGTHIDEIMDKTLYVEYFNSSVADSFENPIWYGFETRDDEKHDFLKIALDHDDYCLIPLRNVRKIRVRYFQRGGSKQ